MVIGVSGEETILHRRGAASIHEQLTMLHYAAAQKADVLVVECMAIDPALQAASQHCILQADVGVITNVRADHADAMGETLREVCEALMHTVPKNGILFTSDARFFPEMSACAALQGSKAVLACPDGSEPALDFPDNVSVALAVCVHLGVPRETALAGMAHFHRDPYAFSQHRIGTNVFLNALSCNDAESTQAVYERARESIPQEMPLVLLLNNRPDRPERSVQMAELAIRLKPAQVLLLGSQKGYLRLRLSGCAAKNDGEYACVMLIYWIFRHLTGRVSWRRAISRITAFV
jgi:poly-gamma-glutamate synthase PgsB/CapB